MRYILALFCILALQLAFTGTAWTKVYIDLEAPAVEKLPIAIQEFRPLGPAPAGPEGRKLSKATAEELTRTLTRDFRFTNLFRIIDPQAFIEDPAASGLTGAETRFADWRITGADALVKGGFTIEGEKLTVEVRLFDTVREVQLFGRRYIGSVEGAGRLAHYVADQLYEEMTGRPGIFSTRILFVSDRTGNKEIYISDYDGGNARQLTKNGSINLSPRWSPDGKRIIYTSYRPGWPCLYMLDLRTGRTTIVSKKKGINIGGRFSPDGTKIALTLSTDKSPELYVLDLASGGERRLTDNYGIDVSPAWSPDGRKIAYVSDTSGNPHIFVLDLTTGRTKRLTFKGKYNSSPAWSPDGKWIAFSRSDNGKFDIWIADPDGKGETQLTSAGNNKSPTWSPDGRHLVFSSTSGGRSSLYMMRVDGGGLIRLSTGVGNETTPAWSPLLN